MSSLSKCHREGETDGTLNLKTKTQQRACPYLFKKAFPKRLSLRNGFLGSTTNAFPGVLPSASPCITAMKESVVGSGPILMPGKSCSNRYLRKGNYKKEREDKQALR